jgi:hypothetical protein
MGRRRGNAVTIAVPPLPPALQGRDEVKRGLRVSALSVPIAALLGNVLEVTNHSVDLIVGHPPDQCRHRDADNVEVVFGFPAAERGIRFG